MCDVITGDTIDADADDPSARPSGTAMSVLDRLDATRLCASSSVALADPAAWARPIPVRRAPVAVPQPQPFSWRAMVRNPNALVFSGMMGTVIAKDAVVRLLTGRP
ncbi:hypothetical protein GCM10027265_31060 [Jatrophihabitans fulvus]